ncbi:RNA-directed DNA polymerase, eukaryota [Artemisia annua]|uniref:RNA-directed DNA polymerase, eukaryota n=1 Tax=Artemisia annua TaxID=35608 RepID=A0A2U1KZ58_ARTAN|nr:RNA-directed DNA polymerase, eukaryota [Artemisia annua]
MCVCERENRERKKKGEEWVEVVGRRGRKDQKGGNNYGIKKGSFIKFFVSNIPEGCRPWDLADRLKEFGIINKVYIAKKKGKDGSRFGFVNFARPQDWSHMEAKMTNVKLGKSILNINLARYAVENEFFGEKTSTRPRTFAQPKVFVPRVNGANLNSRTGFSFSDVVKGNGGAESNERVVEVDSSIDESSDVHNRALVVRCVDMKTLESLGSILSNVGESEVSLPFERIAWIGIYGVPMQLASAELFNKLGGLFGSLVSPSSFSNLEHNLSVVKVGVLVGNGKVIKESVVLSWRNKKFRIWISENPVDWFPSCVIEGNDGSWGDNSMVNGFQAPDGGGTAELEEGELRQSEEEDERGVHGEGNQKSNDVHGEMKTFNAGVHASLDKEKEKAPKFSKGIVGPRKIRTHPRVMDHPSTNINCNIDLDWVQSAAGLSPRPRKRPRSSDPFSLDGLLGINKENINPPPNISPLSQPMDLNCSASIQKKTKEDGNISLDLNNRPSNCEGSSSNGDSNIRIEAMPLPPEPMCVEVDEELLETIATGDVVGVDLHLDEGLVRKVIEDEGIFNVSQ